MQLLNALVALGGDSGNTVPAYGITAAEVRVLQAIHGNDAVMDVEPLDQTVRVTPRAEVERLSEKYRAKNEDAQSIVSVVFPGSGVGMPETVEDLDLPETAFKVLSRVTAKSVAPKVEKAPKTRKTKAAPVVEPEKVDPNSADHLFDDDESLIDEDDDA